MKNLAIAFFLVTVMFLISCGSYSGTSTPAAPVQTQPPAATQSPAPTAAGNVHQITIKNFAFNPAIITIKKGDTVNWTNEDSTSHKVTGPGFDSGTLSSGKSFSYTFKDAGSYDYVCSIHPSIKAKIVVQP